MKYILNIVKKIIAYDKKKNNSEILGIGAIAILPESIDSMLNAIEREASTKKESRKISSSDRSFAYNPVIGTNDPF